MKDLFRLDGKVNQGFQRRRDLARHLHSALMNTR